MRIAAAFAVAAVVLGAFVLLTRGSASSNAVVARVIDGDTIELLGGQRVRLVQIDTPEKHTECYGDAASAVTRRLLPPGTRVRIEQDPGLDQIDRYQRKLAYVWKGDQDVNVTLVRDGAAGVWFYGGTRGRHASEFLQAVNQARTQRKGLWAACPLARFDPLNSMSSGPAT
ncbi:MAG TPA: thermonuclease family protein [Gaiellaceae bacterium]|nr:thermonuclease family protein [Gaiellaceae bacterium]